MGGGDPDKKRASAFAKSWAKQRGDEVIVNQPSRSEEDKRAALMALIKDDSVTDGIGATVRQLLKDAGIDKDNAVFEKSWAEQRRDDVVIDIPPATEQPDKEEDFGFGSNGGNDSE